MKIIAAIAEPAVMVRILTHLGLPLARAAALTGAAAVSLSGGLILVQITTVLQRPLTIPLGPRSCQAV